MVCSRTDRECEEAIATTGRSRFQAPSPVARVNGAPGSHPSFPPVEGGVVMQSTLVIAFSCVVLVMSHDAVWAADLDPARESEIAPLRDAAEGHSANRKAFGFLRCRFRLTEGKAATREDALAGIIVEAVRSEVLWLVDDSGNTRYERLCDPKVYKAGLERAGRPIARQSVEGPAGGAPKGAGGFPGTFCLPCRNERVLRYGGLALSYGDVINASNVFTKGQPQPGIDLNPFSMNMMGRDEFVNPGRLLHDVIEGRVVGRFEGRKTIGGVEVLPVSVDLDARPSNLRWRWCLDPNRGFLPLETSIADMVRSATVSLAVTTEIRACTKDRWFPIRSVIVHNPERAPFRVQIVEVTELDVDRPPRASDFYLDLPAGTNASLPGVPGPMSVRLKAPERILGTELGALRDRIIAAGKSRIAEFEAATGSACGPRGPCSR